VSCFLTGLKHVPLISESKTCPSKKCLSKKCLSKKCRGTHQTSYDNFMIMINVEIPNYKKIAKTFLINFVIKYLSIFKAVNNQKDSKGTLLTLPMNIRLGWKCPELHTL
jgi:hypothetical protein